MDITSSTTRRISPIVAATIIGGLFFVGGQYVASQPQRIQQEVEAKREITVTGMGSVTTTPDVGKITLSLNAGPQSSAATALSSLATRFDDVVAALSKSGVADEDVKATNVSINPEYDYNEGQQRLRGWQASKSVVVTIRDLDQAGAIIAAATAAGVNQVGGLELSVDDPDALQLEAEQEAISQANERAQALANELGARLGDVKTYSSSTNSPKDPQPLYARAELAADSIAAPPFLLAPQT